MSGSPGSSAPLARALLAALLLAVGGCRRSEPPPTPDPEDARDPATMPATVPGLGDAGLDEERLGAAEVMVKGEYDRQDRETYVYRPKHPAGTVKGSCVFVEPDRRAFPPEAEVTFTGEDAVEKPRPKELKYYRNLDLKHRRWFVQVGRGKHVTFRPVNVVLRLRDVRAGRRPALTRPVMVVRQGRLMAGGDANHGANNVQFCPTHERAQFTTWDEYPSRIVVTRRETGEKTFEQSVRYAQGRKETLNEAGRFAYKPTYVVTEPLRSPGLYAVTDARHPWMRGYVWVVDNPYVVCTTTRLYHGRSNWEIANVPPGRHTLEVWHPCFEPVERTIEVDVEANEIAEVLVRFHPPRAPESGGEKRGSGETAATPRGESKN